MDKNIEEFRLNFSLVLAAVLYPFFLFVVQSMSGTENILWPIVWVGAPFSAFMLTPWWKKSPFSNYTRAILGWIAVKANFLVAYMLVHDSHDTFTMMVMITAVSAWNSVVSGTFAIILTAVAPLLMVGYIMTQIPIKYGVVLLLCCATVLLINLLNSMTRIHIVDALFQTWQKLREHYASTAQANHSLDQIAEKLENEISSQTSAAQETSSSVSKIRSEIEATLQSVNVTKEEGLKSIESTNVGEQGLAKLSQEFAAFGERSAQQTREFSNSVNQMNELIEVMNTVKAETSAIDDLVFQTKLLSFNASVEAARAGEQGKGFAVVAEEIATLANSSGVAAGKINSILAQSQDSVRQVVGKVTEQLKEIEKEQDRVKGTLDAFQETVKIFNDIRQSVDRTGSELQDTSHRTHEQKVSLDEIGLAVDSIHKVSNNVSMEFERMSKVRENVRKQTDWIKGFLATFENILPREWTIEESPKESSNRPVAKMTKPKARHQFDKSA